MTTYLSNRDGGLTDEEGHYKFQTEVWDGNVADGLLVTENSPLGMSVLVTGGDAKIPYSDYAYTAWIPDASPEVATITTADPTNPRIDRVVMYIDRAETPQQINPNNPGIAKIAVVAGTPAAVPNRPSDGTVDTAVSNNPWIDLADVLVNDGVSQITDSDITDTRTMITTGPEQRSGGFAIGTIPGATLGTTGNKAITGVGFRPKMVKFRIRSTALTTGFSIGEGAMINNGTQYYTAESTNGTTANRNGSTSACIAWITAASSTTTPSLLASYVSMDSDGFTINVTTAASAFDVSYEAYA